MRLGSVGATQIWGFIQQKVSKCFAVSDRDDPLNEFIEAFENGSVSQLKEAIRREAQIETPGDISADRLRAAFVSLIEELLKFQDINERNSAGDTLLHLASYGGISSLVSVLLEFGADKNATNHEGWTPLHKAVYVGQVLSTQVLLEAGADVNSPRGGDGGTALHIVSSTGSATITRILINFKANIFARTKPPDSLTPFDIAERRNSFAVYDILEERKKQLETLIQPSKNPHFKRKMGEKDLSRFYSRV